MGQKKFTVGGLFSGVGGIEQGFLNNGFEILWSNDIDEPSSKTFKLNFEHRHILRDIHLLKGGELEPVDVLVGGFRVRLFLLLDTERALMMIEGIFSLRLLGLLRS